MNTTITYRGYRFFWLAFGGLVGVQSLLVGLQSAGIGATLQGFGMITMGFVWFLQPLIPSRNISKIFSQSSGSAIGPQPLRILLTFLAAGMLVAGLVIRYLIGA